MISSERGLKIAGKSRVRSQKTESSVSVWKTSPHVLRQDTSRRFPVNAPPPLCFRLCVVSGRRDRILAQRFLSIRFWQKEQMGFLWSVLSASSPQLQPRYPRSPHSLRLQPLYPPQPAVHGLFAISSKRLIVLLRWRQERKKITMDLSRVCVSWKARPQVSGYNTQRDYKLAADHRSNMQYWWPASPVATAAVIVSN